MRDPRGQRPGSRPVTVAPGHRDDERLPPATVQLGTGSLRVLTRGLFGRCPACGSGKLFRRWFTMADECPRCSFHFERIEGHWIGAIGANTVCSMGLMLIALVAAIAVSYPDPLPGYMLWVELVIAGLGPAVFYPASRTLWTAIDLLMRPLEPGEIDPAFLKVPWSATSKRASRN